jgi:hypothetical protein
MTDAPKFYDFGCGFGGSMHRWQRMFECKGRGFDSVPDKVRGSQAKGLDVQQADLMKLAPGLPDNTVRFVVMNHLLEHMPTYQAFRWMIDHAGRIADQFVYMAFPWFGSDNDLFILGLKKFCTDWPGVHTLNPTALQVDSALRASGRFAQAVYFGLRSIERDDHRHLFSLREDTKKNTSAHNHYAYVPGRHLPRPSTGSDLPFVCFEEFACLAFIQPDESIVEQYAATWGATEIKRVEY